MKGGVAAAASLLLVGVLFALPSETPGHVVKIKGMVFVPAILHIAKGEKVTWVNEDIVVHAVKAIDPKSPWQSKDLPPRDSWSQDFESSAAYICPYHPTMTGQIVVDPSPKP